MKEVQDKGQQRRRTSASVQRSQRHPVTGEPWRNTGACGSSVRAGSLSRSSGYTTSGLFSDIQPLEGSDATAFRPESRQRAPHRVNAGAEGSTKCSEMRRKACGPVRRSSSMPAGERWRTTGACSGMPRPAWLSRPNGGTTSGLFSEVGSLAQTQHRPLRSSSLSRFPKKKKPDLKPAPSDDLTSTSDDSKSEVEDRRLPHERIA